MKMTSLRVGSGRNLPTSALDADRQQLGLEILVEPLATSLAADGAHLHAASAAPSRISLMPTMPVSSRSPTLMARSMFSVKI